MMFTVAFPKHSPAGALARCDRLHGKKRRRMRDGRKEALQAPIAKSA